MFETAELGAQVSAEEYDKRVPLLRKRLLDVQADLKTTDVPVVLLFGGVDGAGKGETASLLSWWMDPRRIQVRAYGRPTDEERGRPEFWRFWRDLPAKGRMGVVLRAWYSKPLLQRVYDRIDEREFEQQLEQIVEFERTLADDHTLILKFWMHLGKEQQAERLRELEADPVRSWRVTERDWDHWRRYDEFVDVSGRLIARTSTARAPWTILEGWDPRYRTLEVGTRLLEAMERAVESARHRAEGSGGGGVGTPASAVAQSPHRVNVLSSLNMKRSATKDEYQKELPRLTGRLNQLQRAAASEKRSIIAVFEGWDAAGKGSAIRRVVYALDARDYKVFSVAAPSDEEQAHHYMWRFWRHIPMSGQMLIWDRSWYGRVLVERIEQFAGPDEWARAYREINEFEAHLTRAGAILLKFWLHVSEEEQQRRFEERRTTPYKSWKLTDEDLRNRARRPDYETAVHEMVLRTSTPSAPWILVEADSKRFARLRILNELCQRAESELGIEVVEPPVSELATGNGRDG